MTEDLPDSFGSFGPENLLKLITMHKSRVLLVLPRPRLYKSHEVFKLWELENRVILTLIRHFNQVSQLQSKPNRHLTQYTLDFIYKSRPQINVLILTMVKIFVIRRRPIVIMLFILLIQRLLFHQHGRVFVLIARAFRAAEGKHL